MSRIAVVVPCYNEADRLDASQFIQFSHSHGWVDWIFVDDGSRDRTGDLLQQLCQELPGRCSALRLEQNQGKAEAVRRGVCAAFSHPVQAVAFWDADLATPLEMLPRMRDTLSQRPDVDIVLGTRMPLLGRRIVRRRSRQWLGRVFAWAASQALGLRIFDTQCGAKLFRRTPLVAELFRTAFRSRWIFDVEIMARYLQLRREGLACGDVYELPLDDWREIPGSKLKSRDFVRAARELAVIAWHHRWVASRAASARAAAGTAARARLAARGTSSSGAARPETVRWTPPRESAPATATSESATKAA